MSVFKLYGLDVPSLQCRESRQSYHKSALYYDFYQIKIVNRTNILGRNLNQPSCQLSFVSRLSNESIASPWPMSTSSQSSCLLKLGANDDGLEGMLMLFEEPQPSKLKLMSGGLIDFKTETMIV